MATSDSPGDDSDDLSTGGECSGAGDSGLVAVLVVEDRFGGSRNCLDQVFSAVIKGTSAVGKPITRGGSHLASKASARTWNA